MRRLEEAQSEPFKCCWPRNILSGDVQGLSEPDWFFTMNGRIFSHIPPFSHLIKSINSLSSPLQITSDLPRPGEREGWGMEPTAQ